MLNRIRVALASPDAVRRLRDFVLATLIYSLPIQLRRRIFAGNQYCCPVCNTPLRTFLRLNRPFFAWCPICRSLQRHRLIALLLERLLLPGLAERRQPCILHFAPEQGLQQRFQEIAAQRYISLDRYDHQAMLLADICAIPLGTATVDLIYCSHVLEHIEQDQLAMRELARVLHSDGTAIILVPLRGEHSFEDASVTTPVERERVFGQHDHVRWYGSDIRERLEQAGFGVQVLHSEDLASPAEQQLYGIDAGETIFVCRPGSNINSE